MESPVTAAQAANTPELATRWRRCTANAIDCWPLLFLFWMLLLNLLTLAYFLTRDALPMLGGQSVGKRLMKIRVLKQDGLTTTQGEFGLVFLRTAPEFLPIVNFVDIGYMFSKSRQRIGDRRAKTIVVSSRS